MFKMHTKNVNRPQLSENSGVEKLSDLNFDEESSYKPVSPVPPPPSKPPPSDTELEPGSGLTLRMPPLYGEEQMTSQQQSAGLQTHSSKFPIEREVVLSLGEKNSKIPILHEYKQRSAGRVAIAPDAPIKQQAWVHEATQMQDSRQDIRSRSYQSSETYSTPIGIGATKTAKLDDEKTKTLSRTYHTIKDMISSRFGPNRKDVEPETEASLNNVTEELRKSSRSINEEEVKRQETTYIKPRAQEPTINMQQYPKNTYGQYGHSYSYQGGQQNIPLPGQLPSQIPPNLPSGQSAQLHVTHHTPPGGIQTVHQTQISAFAQSTSVVQNSNRDYVMQNSAGMSNQSMHQIHHQTHQTPSHNQNQVNMPMKHPMQQSQGMMQSSGPNCQSSQQILHQNQQHHQSPRFAQQHAQNMHQRQLIQQMQQQQQQQNSVGLPSPQNALRNQHPHFANGNGPVSNYQQYQQSRQSMSRSQIDLPSTSRQLAQDLRIPSQDVYYHYNQNRSHRFGTPQIYSRNEGNNQQENEFQRRNSGKGIEKALSQPQLSYDEGKHENDGGDEANKAMKNLSIESGEDKEKYEISVEEHQPEHFSRNGSRRTNIEEYRPETSFGIRSEESRSSSRKDYSRDRAPDGQESTGTSVQKRIEELRRKSEIEPCLEARPVAKSTPKIEIQKREDNCRKPEEANAGKKEMSYNSVNKEPGLPQKKDDLEHGMGRLKIQHQGSGSDYDKTGQSSSNVDSGRGSAVYSSGRRLPPEDSNLTQGQDAEWVDIVESELRSILEPKDVPAVTHSTLSDSVSSVTPPLPPLTPQESPRTRSRFSASLPYGVKPNYGEYIKGSEKRNYPSTSKHRSGQSSKKEAAKKFSHLFGVEAADMTSTTTGLDLDSMLDRSDSDLSTNDARTIRKQLEGLENMYSEVLKLLGGSTKKRRKTRGLASYGSVSSLPTSSVSSRPIARHHDKRRSHTIDDRMKKAKDVKSINKRFQRIESHVVTLARSVAHLSSEMRTQHIMIQEMENIRGEIAALRTQTNMAMVRSQSQPVIKDSELPALSNPSRVKKLTKFFGTEPPLIRLFLRELGYEKYAGAFEKERVGMVELPYLSEERLQKMGVPLGPRLRILQEARISVCKDPVYVV